MHELQIGADKKTMRYYMILYANHPMLLASTEKQARPADVGQEHLPDRTRGGEKRPGEGKLSGGAEAEDRTRPTRLRIRQVSIPSPSSFAPICNQ